MSSTLAPAFEVTNVDSMQWNRTCAGTDSCAAFEPAESDPVHIPADVLADIKAAISQEIDYIKA
ncbi:hypothetical protein ACWDBW_23735 [Streptomyces sp. NPDC001107]